MFRQSVASVYSRWEALPLRFHSSSHYSSGQLIRADGESYHTASCPQRPVPSPSCILDLTKKRKNKSDPTPGDIAQKKKIQTGPPTTGFACARVKSKFCLKDICPVDHKIRTKICAQQILLDTNFSTNLVVHDSSAGTLGAKKKKLRSCALEPWIRKKTAFMCA
jgi:hypothetical protein